MTRPVQVMITVFLGALIGGALTAGTFLLATLLDGTAIAEAFGFSLVVAVVGTFLGGIVGLIVGLGNPGSFGGALAGLLVALVVVAIYVLGFGRSGQYGYFLSESRVIVAGLTAPLILTGLATALLKNALNGRN